jgi:hypothetical protein
VPWLFEVNWSDPSSELVRLQLLSSTEARIGLFFQFRWAHYDELANRTSFSVLEAGASNAPSRLILMLNVNKRYVSV